MTLEIRNRFNAILRKYLPGILQDQLDLLAGYSDVLSGWNEKINLVSRKERENIWNHQVIGSILFLFRFQFEQDSAIVDIGTGGGLPGIPLAILHPDSRVLLVDSINKKIIAVSDMITQLGLKNVQAIWSRAEDLAQMPAYVERFDYVTARAVAPTIDILKWGAPFLKPYDAGRLDEACRVLPRGSLLMIKGGELAGEIHAAEVKFHPKQIVQFPLPFLEEIPGLTDKKLIVVRPR